MKFIKSILTLIILGMSFSSGAQVLKDEELHFLMQIRPAYKEICGNCRFEFSDLRVSLQKQSKVSDMKVRTEGIRWGRSFLLPVEKNGEQVGWVSGQVKMLQLGLRALRALPSGSPVRPSDVRPDWIDVTLMKDQLAQVQDLEGFTAKKFFAVRDPILRGDLRMEPVVKRGQVMNVITGNELFSVATQMKAEESGAPGDMIRVKGVENNKIISVRVQQDGTGRFE